MLFFMWGWRTNFGFYTGCLPGKFFRADCGFMSRRRMRTRPQGLTIIFGRPRRTGFFRTDDSEAEGDNETPVVIGGCEKPPDDFSADAMVWWGAEVSPFFGRFAQLIEIVPGIPAATERARERYKFYQEHGYRITLHNLKK